VTQSRADFLAERRWLGSVRMDTLFAPTYDEDWGAVSPSHQAFVRRLTELTPDNALLLDAACGTGKYWPQLIAANRRMVGVDRSAGMLAQAKAKFPAVETRQLDLVELNSVTEWAARFDGLLCVDAMENVTPEDWPVALAGFARVVKPRSPIYLTVEIPGEDDRRAAANPQPPLVDGEVLWPGEHGGGYHYYPGADLVASWLAATGLTVLETADADGYQHILGRTAEAGPTRYNRRYRGTSP
jgi:cyclopropane fatty-acyl-phospholipid synthase-like methyltransferase